MNLIKKSSVLLTALATFTLVSCGGTVTMTKDAAKTWLDEHKVAADSKETVQKVKNVRCEYDFSKCKPGTDGTDPKTWAELVISSTITDVIDKDIWTYAEGGIEGFKLGSISGNKWVTVKDDDLAKSVDSSKFQVNDKSLDDFKGYVEAAKTISLVDNKYLVLNDMPAPDGQGYWTAVSYSINTSGMVDAARFDYKAENSSYWLVLRLTHKEIKK